MSPRLDMSSGESVTRVHVNPLPLAKNAMHSFSSKDTINRLLVSRPPPASSSTSRVPPIFQPGKIYAHAQVNKRYVTVLELTDSHPGVQLSRTVFATMDLYYPTRRFDAIFASNDWKNCEDFAKWNNNNNRPPTCIRPRLWDRKQPIKYSWPNNSTQNMAAIALRP